MASRDDQEFERRRQQIIDGALTLFAEKGFEKTTNQEIAQAAGIGSPGLIYHYFENKADLLHQAVTSRSPLLQSIIHDDALMGKPPRVALHLIGSAFLGIFREPDNVKFFRVILGEALRDPAVTEVLKRSGGPKPALEALARYLRVQMQAGRLRPIDPAIAARCFLGPFLLTVVLREVFGQADTQAVIPDNMVDTAVEIFLRGLEVT